MNANNIAQQRYDHARQIIYNTILPRIYQLIFETPQFPFWFTSNCLWAICVASKATDGKKFRIPLSFVLTALMTFVPTELSAFFIGKESPLKQSLYSVYLCILLWAITEIYTSSLLQKFKKYLGLIAAPLHTFNMMRILHYYTDETRKISWESALICGILLSISDIAIERIFKFFIKGTDSPFTRGTAFLRIIFAFVIFFLLTEETPAMIVFGVLPYKPVGLVIAVLYASMEFAVLADDIFTPKDKTY